MGIHSVPGQVKVGDEAIQQRTSSLRQDLPSSLPGIEIDEVRVVTSTGRLSSQIQENGGHRGWCH